jgi:hypothetical protein
MTRSRISVLSGIFLVAAALTLLLVLLTARSSGTQVFTPKAGADADSAAATPGLGPTSYEAYLQAARTYPANVIPPRIVARAKATFNRIAQADARRRARLARLHGRSFLGAGRKWKQYGPKDNATQPGVTSFSGATNNTASRITALVADPDCTAKHCRLWASTSGGGVWRTDDAGAPNPDWTKLGPKDLDQNSTGSLVLDPTDKKHDTLYLGTGEALFF